MLNNYSLVLILALFSGHNYVLSCRLKITGSPVLTRDFGSKTIVFKAHEEYLTLEDGETIKAHCRGIWVAGSKRDDLYYGYNEMVETSLEDTAIFSCESTSLKVEHSEYPHIQVSCPSYPPVSLYESNKKLPKCTQFLNYAIGFKLPVGDIIKAGVCYDLDNLNLKFASYVAYEKKLLVMNKFHIGNELSLNLKQELIGFSKYFDFVNLESEVQPLATTSFNTNEFQFDILLQDAPLKTELNDFKYIFNIMWWRQLRQENWRFFLNALSERTKAVKYVVHVGTFGNVTIPTAPGNCTSSKNEVVSIGNEDMTINAPGYIWAYLKSVTPDVEEEFVVIGHNSPYKRDPDHSEFCAVDMCDEIEWLKNSKFGNLRNLASLGYTFCCPAEEVANKIDYFPFKATEIVTSTPQPWITE